MFKLLFFLILYYDQQKHQYLTNYHIATETTQDEPPFTYSILLLVSNPYTSLFIVCRENFSTNVPPTKTLSSNKSETTT
jgi:hypothetical protein